MASTKFYLDRRTSLSGNLYPLKLRISRKRSVALINLNIKLLTEQWDSLNGKIINHPQQQFQISALWNFIKTTKPTRYGGAPIRILSDCARIPFILLRGFCVNISHHLSEARDIEVLNRDQDPKTSASCPEST